MAKPWHNYPPGLKASLFARDGGHCRIQLPGCTHHTHTPCPGCAQELDHIIPPRNGGSWYSPDNLRASCKVCNQRRRRGTPTPPVRPPTTPENW